MTLLLFQAKYDLFEDLHARVRDAPDPERAERHFARHLKTAKVVNRVRAGLYAVLYFGLIATAFVFLLDFLDEGGLVQQAIRTVAGITSSVTIVAAAGILGCGRYLNLADVRLYFLSVESRCAT